MIKSALLYLVIALALVGGGYPYRGNRVMTGPKDASSSVIWLMYLGFMDISALEYFNQ